MPPPPDAQIPIAIIGLSCRFPGEADNATNFWSLLKKGQDAYSPTTTRWNPSAFYHPDSSRLNTLPTRGGHFLAQDPYVFDASFFNITAAEATAFDPKQRICLEVAYEAMENAGLTLPKIAGSQTACYIGSSMTDYRDSISRDFGNVPKYHVLGTCEEMLSNRISHFMDIHGPSATVHTACSSSLVATHLACQSLRSGESEMAIAGGVSMMLTPDATVQLNNLSFLNPEGHSRSFDADAGGYGRGEGCGILVLKRLDQAIHDGDTVRAVIRASGVNSDGWTQGVTMPSTEAQAALIKQVYESNGLDYQSTQYVEAHGTGTKAGDPVETSAIHRTIGQGATKSRKLWIGSVKPNIGHLEAAAGVAGIIKGVLSMEKGLIPPNIHFNKLNPAIPFEEWNMAIPLKLMPWPTTSKAKRMSISGFGLGGTNGHVVLEGFSRARAALTNVHTKAKGPKSQHSFGACQPKKRLFTISSHDQAGFSRLGASLVAHLGSSSIGALASSPSYLADLSHTLSVARSGLSWLACCVAESVTELTGRLSAQDGKDAVRRPTRTPRIGFVFTGQGAQWAGMGVELLSEPTFAASVEKSALFLRSMGCEWDPAEEMSKRSGSRVGSPEISQPICTVLQIALVELLRSWGVQPAKVVGHSSGEMGAAYAIGALSHRDAIAAAFFRGKASAGLKTVASDLKGGMMAVGASREDAERWIAEAKLMSPHAGQVIVACVNSPSSITLSGDVEALEVLRLQLERRDVFARRLKVDVAYHSAHMSFAVSEYSTSIADIEPLQSGVGDLANTAATQVMVSSVTGREASPELLGPYYWVRNLVSPVLFSDAVAEMLAPVDMDDGRGLVNPVDILIEIGPHSALKGPVEQTLAHHGVQNMEYMSVLTRGQDALDTSLRLAADLFLRGAPLSIQHVNGDPSPCLLTDLPPYPWNHSHVFRADSRIQKELMWRQFPKRSILGAQVPMMDETQYVWRNFLRLSEEPWLRGHKVGGTVLLPGAGLVSMVLEAVQQLVDSGKKGHSLKLRDMSFLAAVLIPEEIEIITTLRPHLLGTSGSTPASWWEFTVSSCATTGADQLRDNCRGLVAIEYLDERSQQMVQEDDSLEAAKIASYHQVRQACPQTLTKDMFYRHMEISGFGYSEIFQGIQKLYVGDGQGAFEIDVMDIGETFSSGHLDRPFLINGAVLDSIFQATWGSTWRNGAFHLDKPYVPTYIGQLEISLDTPSQTGYTMPGSWFSRKHGFNQFSADITAYDKGLSRVFLSVTDLRASEMDINLSPADGEPVVDAADIRSDVRWNYAQSLLKPHELDQALSKLEPDDQVTELLSMIVHENPGTTVVELVLGHGALGSTFASRLTSGTIKPSQLRFAVHEEDMGNHLKHNPGFGGEIFSLSHINDGPSLPEQLPSTLLIIPGTVSELNGVTEVVERFVALAMAKSTIIVTSANDTIRGILERHGYSLVFKASTPGSLATFSRDASPKTMANGPTSSVQSNEAVILTLNTRSAASTEASSAIRAALDARGYSTSVAVWSDGVPDWGSKMCVSLLEWERPMLSELLEADFGKIRDLVLHCERLLWITRGDDPLLGMVDGFARTMRTERIEARFQVLHLSSGLLDADHSASLVANILTSKHADDEFREVSGLLQVGRIFPSPAGNDSLREHLENSTHITPLSTLNYPIQLTIGRPGLLDTLHFVKDTRTMTEIKDDEVEIQVKASGVNFRDVMAAMGLVSTPILGFEASGIVVVTGTNVQSFKPGDRVCFVGQGLHGTKMHVPAKLVAHIPSSVSFEDAAALPMVHSTAYHCLMNLARLRRGQSILIHAAAGGVGQAAVQLALHLGLIVFVTVGVKDKRNLIIDQFGITADHIFNSRDSSFVKGIQRVTGGRGVDCVLNSLSGELLRASWSCLATFGTFVELGLRDITDNTRLDMRPFSKVTTFTFCNILTLIQEDVDMMGSILSEAMQLVKDGTLSAPTPTVAYPIGQVQEAFRTMQQGKHVGKLVISFTGEDARAPVLREARSNMRLKADATYLIVGGLGGLGRSLAKELVEFCGARHIAFLSRAGDKSLQARNTMAELSSSRHSARVKAYAADIADESSFLDVMARCSREMPPVKGVIQMAMVIRDVVFEKMSYEQWTLPLRSKVAGTANLHKYFSRDKPLDFFTICSSTSGLYGNASQAQYAAGNTYQDALAQHRRAQGLKAVSVNLGIMRDVGVLAEQGATGHLKQWERALGIREPAFHALMKSLIADQLGPVENSRVPPQACTGLGTGDIVAAHALEKPEYFNDPRFGPLAILSSSVRGASGTSGEQAAGASLLARLAEVGGPDEAAPIILDALTQKVADILQMPASEVDSERPMYRYGVDSLIALEVRNWITREIRASVTLLEILAAMSIKEFAKLLAGRSKAVGGDAP